MVAVLLVIVMAGLGRAVTVYVNGVPLQVLLVGVNAYGVIVYRITASVVLERFTSESIILPVPLLVLPVALPEVTADIQEKVLPAIAEVGVKFND